MKTLFIGKQFSDDPAGRYYTDGDGNGEEFREEVLKPILAAGKPFKINIDENVEGYGYSFLVEAFGGLVKHGYFDKEYIKSKIEVVYLDTDFEFYADKIYKYLDEAKYNSMKYISSKKTAVDENRYNDSIDKNFIKEFL